MTVPIYGSFVLNVFSNVGAKKVTYLQNEPENTVLVTAN